MKQKSLNLTLKNNTNNMFRMLLKNLNKKYVFGVLLLSLFLFSCKSSDNPKEVATYPTPELLQNLSDIGLFKGAMSNIEPVSTVEVYNLQTALFTDYCHKTRFLSIPEGESMQYVDDGFPNYPDNTILAKTFYYYNDERDHSQGKKIIETRVLIKKAGVWEIGNYLWNDAQTDAVRTENSHIVPITWINDAGESNSIDYEVPDYASCVNCHQNAGVRTPIGPKLRNMNTTHNGENQLQHFIDKGLLTGVDAGTEVLILPKWNDTQYTKEQRSRAYLDVNCAHCHQPGGFYDMQFGSTFEFRYETRMSGTGIFEKRDAIVTRMHSNVPNYGMPYIGTTIKHTEGIALIEDWLNSL